ncbi:hypothetical protein DF156_25920 [Burkholderia ubonensis]|nr:hypothetical protein CJO66_28775 [Burkholderia ubonensis]RQP32234.1 hypothetical protein DF154_27380 [Burkholderia ubonensis]RQP34747.1 hypothetical protein DF156_25920 [Burkholderia ubonensis]RQP37874.1 hypothetical protein DF155_09810 [Burkholderia ubonensis]RQP49690.1 hypothetical protein DF144_24070 [Burkholderia ubonensis]
MSRYGSGVWAVRRRCPLRRDRRRRRSVRRAPRRLRRPPSRRAARCSVARAGYPTASSRAASSCFS